MVKKIAIVSLSSGIIGEAAVSHERDLGLRRLREYGLQVVWMDHAQKGIQYLSEHPEKRAEDLLHAFRDESIDMILCAIGGDDTYRLLPFLFDNDELRKALKKKVFLGFSDTTFNHFMLHKLGLNTFYGQAFLPDICELGSEMLPYTRHYFDELIRTGTISQVEPSSVWYEERAQWGPDQLGVNMQAYPNNGYELLQGSPVFEGKILGGCIDSIYDMFDSGRYPDTVELCDRYGIFPPLEDWKGRILLLETSEEKATPDKYRKMVTALKKTGIFTVVSGVLMGKPQNETYFTEYKEILQEVVDDPTLPIAANINVGHATPRCILPFGIPARVDVTQQRILFDAEA